MSHYHLYISDPCLRVLLVPGQPRDGRHHLPGQHGRLLLRVSRLRHLPVLPQLLQLQRGLEVRHGAPQAPHQGCGLINDIIAPRN